MENIREKAQDDEDFLFKYGSMRTGIASKAYREGWDKIFAPDRIKHSVDANSGEVHFDGDNIL
jgi:hypothetical protein